MKLKIFILNLLFFLSGCSLFSGLDKTDYRALCFAGLSQNNDWSTEKPIEIIGYNDSAMEPQISADGNVLFFNNKTDNDKEMDIHYAIRTEALKFPDRFIYKGKLAGVSVDGYLDGTPTVDQFNNLYFVSLREYGKNYQTMYTGEKFILKNGIINLAEIKNIDVKVTRAKLLNVDMGVDVSWDGKILIISRADFSFFKTYPNSSYLEFANINPKDPSAMAEPDLKSLEMLQQVNNKYCRAYAASLSEDNLELYYTIFPMGPDLRPDNFRIVVAKRKSANDMFSQVKIISTIAGQFTEAPSLSFHDHGKSLYFHRLDTLSGKYKIYKVLRK